MLNNSVFIVGRISQGSQEPFLLVYVHCIIPFPSSVGGTCEYDEVVIPLIRLHYTAKEIE